MKTNSRVRLYMGGAVLTSLLVLFQNCGPAKIVGGETADGSNGSAENYSSLIGTQVDLPTLLTAPKEPASNVLYPVPGDLNDFDYAKASPVLENLVLKNNNFQRIEWIHAASHTIVAVGETFQRTSYGSELAGLYYVIGYRDQSPYQITKFRLTGKGATSLGITSAGAIQSSQRVVETASPSESYFILVDAPDVDLAAIKAVIKSTGVTLLGRRALYVTKPIDQATEIEFELVDITGQSMKKTISLLAKNPPATPTGPTPTPTPTPAPTPTPTPVAMSPVKVLPMVVQDVTGRSGSAITIALQFQVVPMPKNYNVFIHFVDSTGLIRSEMSTNYAPPVPTTSWNGYIGYSISIPVQAATPLGAYSIYVGLFDNVGRALLTPGTGVTMDNQTRYKVGTFTKQ